MFKKLSVITIITLSASMLSFWGLNVFLATNNSLKNKNFETYSSDNFDTYPTSPSTNCTSSGTDLYYELSPTGGGWGENNIYGNNEIFYDSDTETWKNKYDTFYISTESTVSEYIEYNKQLYAYITNTSWQLGDWYFDDMTESVTKDDFKVSLFSLYQFWDSDGLNTNNPDETNDIPVEYYDEKISYFATTEYVSEYDYYYLNFWFATLIEPTTTGIDKGFCNYTYTENASDYNAQLQFYDPFDLNDHQKYIEEYLKVNFKLDYYQVYTLDEVNEKIEQYINDYFDYINVELIETVNKFNTLELTTEQRLPATISNYAPSSYYELEITYSIPLDTVIWDESIMSEPIEFQVTIKNNNDVAFGEVTIDVEAAFIGYIPLDPETINNSHLPLIISSSVIAILTITTIVAILFYKNRNKEKDSNVEEKE